MVSPPLSISSTWLGGRLSCCCPDDDAAAAAAVVVAPVLVQDANASPAAEAAFLRLAAVDVLRLAAAVVVVPFLVALGFFFAGVSLLLVVMIFICINAGVLASTATATDNR